MRKVSLDDYTTFGIGGQANGIVLTADTPLPDLTNDFVLLGNGSNVLISDNGVSCPVLLDRRDGFALIGNRLTAQSGCLLTKLADYTARRGLSGLEWACGLPARVGGAVATNAGAFGSSMGESVCEVTCLLDGKRVALRANECGFSYRTSRFGARDLVLEAVFDLVPLGETACLANLAKVRQGRARQPKGRSAGCIYRTHGRSAGWYIEQAGLKGKRIGDIMISPVHAGFFLNVGRGRAADVVRLMDYAEKAVADKFGVTLQREIRLIGDF